MDSHPRRSRLLLKGAVVLLVLAGVFVAIGPTLASHVVVPGLLRDAIAERIDGDVTIGSLHLSWFGSQRVDDVAVVSALHETEVLLSIGVDRSLLGLLQDSSDLGEVAIELAGATAVFGDGSTGLTRMMRETDDAPPTEPSDDEDASAMTTRLTLNISSFELNQRHGGSIEIVDAAIALHADTFADVALKVDGVLTLRPDISDDFLSIIHPIFEDVAPAESGIGVEITTLDAPMDFALAALDVDATLEIGDVQLLASNAGSRLLSMLAGTMTNDLDARLGPLRVTMHDGVVSYENFQIDVGRLDDGTFKQTFVFDGAIDVAADPPRVIAISAAYPATNLLKIFKELDRVPRSLLETLRPTVVFSGPLYNASGERIPLSMKLDPFDFDDGFKPEQVQGLIRGLGDLIRGRE